MKYENSVYFRQALLLRKQTGKSLRICYFCVSYMRGDYKRALDFCTGKRDTEDGRRSQAA